MALDAVKFLRSKFLKSVAELESDLPGIKKKIIPIFNEIKTVIKEIDLLPEGDTYSELIIELYKLNDEVADCRLFTIDRKEPDKIMSPLKTTLRIFSAPSFVGTIRIRLSAIKLNLREFISSKEHVDNSVRNVGPILPSQAIGANEQSNLDMRARHQEITNPLENRGAEVSSSIVEFDEQAKRIEDLLLGGTSSEVSAIGVVGVAGVGKTTLVQKVLERKRVKENFSPLLWIPFFSRREGQQQYSRLFFETCIIDMGGKSADETHESIVGLDKLSERLNQLLSDKKYLIVLDDVCQKHINIEERLCCNLPKGSGGAVIITSRMKEVTRKLVEPKNLILVKPLERDVCWRIFEETMGKKSASLSNSEVQSKEELMYQCHGLPSVAKALAEIMSFDEVNLTVSTG